MDTLTIIAIALIVYGLITLSIAVFKPKKVWEIGKIQGFVQLFGETGTVIFFIIIAALTIGGGIWILI